MIAAEAGIGAASEILSNILYYGKRTSVGWYLDKFPREEWEEKVKALPTVHFHTDRWSSEWPPRPEIWSYYREAGLNEPNHLGIEAERRLNENTPTLDDIYRHGYVWIIKWDQKKARYYAKKAGSQGYRVEYLYRVEELENIFKGRYQHVDKDALPPKL